MNEVARYSKSKQKFNIQGPILKNARKVHANNLLGKIDNRSSYYLSDNKMAGLNAEMISSFELND